MCRYLPLTNMTGVDNSRQRVGQTARFLEVDQAPFGQMLARSSLKWRRIDCIGIINVCRHADRVVDRQVRDIFQRHVTTGLTLLTVSMGTSIYNFLLNLFIVWLLLNIKCFSRTIHLVANIVLRLGYEHCYVLHCIKMTRADYSGSEFRTWIEFHADPIGH